MDGAIDLTSILSRQTFPARIEAILVGIPPHGWLPTASRRSFKENRPYLERSPQKYDAIIIDPPPPLEAAGSSLLYSEEFYAVAKQRLQADGIFQQWLPSGDNELQSSVTRAIQGSFPYVRVFRSVEGRGWHFLASMHPIPVRSAADLVARMPVAAVADMMEWGSAKTPADQFNLMLRTELTTGQMIGLSPGAPALQDDRPINEYFLLRYTNRSENDRIQ